jgi:hypothetical protein
MRNLGLPILTPAQCAVMENMWQGAYERIRSGPHLKKLAELGLIARAETGPQYSRAGQYEPTEYARDVLTKAACGSWRNYMALRCVECGHVIP